ncbi:hypothetical protein [Cryptosporangium phraense]|uniref:Uncharacterized protein n=1 Tax=Cryptosporangium phraense TaxID=2593070 RepID=A0A545AYW2_9ACTN|nr:hypothetical protein [Cryptosporangium phraense]TQS46511.1 hypothetical protein FL583_03765 [Cryptosporangium phraense]
MSAERDELRRIVEELPEEEVVPALDELRRHLRPAGQRPWPPAFFGAGTSRRPGVARRVDEILSERFGRS